jgi:ATP-binding cassette, subfamily C, bacterial CydD
MEVLKTSFLSALVLELSSTISTAVLAVNLGLRLVYGGIEFFEAFFVLVLAPEFYLPLRQLGLRFHSSLNGQVAIEKIESLETSLKEEDKLNKSLSIEGDTFSIEVRNLCFSHSNNKEILNNVSFKINQGEKVALIGESGSGKSTLINILSGLLKADDGMVFINGKDMNHMIKEEYLKKISMVPQFPHIFNMSVKDNVLLGKEKIDEKELVNILAQTRVDEFARGFKNSYETIIGEGEDTQISGGEKQRIASARALVKDTDLIIFDEPTSSLDPETEELIPRLISKHLNNRAVLIATHRLNTLKAADKILVLQKGTLVEAGSRDELMEKRGKYYSLLQSEEEQL